MTELEATSDPRALVPGWFRSALGVPAHDDAGEALAAAAALATGFLEALPHPQDGDRPVVERLPPTLREELRRMEAWRPT